MINEVREQLNKTWRLYQNYIIIAILSCISVFFLPMLGSEVNIGFKLPNTTAGWVVYIVTKLSIVCINILLMDQFVKQAKVNVREDKHFIEADEYFNSKETEEYLPKPREFLGRIYRNKMITTTIFSILSIFGFTQAILTFDWVSMLTYLFTIVIGIVFGWITMNEVEIYWTETYYKLYKRDKKEKENADLQGN
jgi:hypothetical protein